MSRPGKGFQHLGPNLNCGAMSRLWRENMRSIWRSVCPDVPFDGFINSLCQMGVPQQGGEGKCRSPQAHLRRIFMGNDSPFETYEAMINFLLEKLMDEDGGQAKGKAKGDGKDDGNDGGNGGGGKGGGGSGGGDGWNDGGGGTGDEGSYSHGGGSGSGGGWGSWAGWNGQPWDWQQPQDWGAWQEALGGRGEGSCQDGSQYSTGGAADDQQEDWRPDCLGRLLMLWGRQAQPLCLDGHDQLVG